MPDSGWSRSQLIAFVNKRTEQRGADALDMNSEYLVALQELCQLSRWWWRRRSLKFTLTAGNPDFDIASVDAMSGLALERIAKDGMRIFPVGYNPSTQTAVQYCSPLFDASEQDLLIEDTVSKGMPRRYFPEPGSLSEMRYWPTPDAAYGVRCSAWVMPDTSPDEQSDTIVLVPGYLHHILGKKMECQVLQYTIGKGSAQYQAAEATYQRALLNAQTNPDFSEGNVKNWAVNDQGGGSAIQSTR